MRKNVNATQFTPLYNAREKRIYFYISYREFVDLVDTYQQTTGNVLTIYGDVAKEQERVLMDKETYIKLRSYYRAVKYC